MLVNMEVIIGSVLEKTDEYRKQFPRMVAEIDQLAKKPKCKICINSFFKRLLNQPNLTQGMAIIFEDPELSFAQDVQDFIITNNDKTATRSKSKVEVHWVTPKEAKDFIERYTADKMVRSINTTYVPSSIENVSGKIMVTLHWSTL